MNAETSLSLHDFALAHARAAAAARRLKPVRVATGLGESWLRKFSRGKIPKPGSEPIERLVRHFLENPAILTPAPALLRTAYRVKRAPPVAATT